MNRFLFLFDRTAVLFLGIAAGTAIGFAFARNGGPEWLSFDLPATPPASAPPGTAPPPPTLPAAPVGTPGGAVDAQAAAPTAETPPDPPSAGMLDSVRQGSIVRVGVFGDSFGDGVWTALYRLLPAKAGYQVSKYSQPSTGFTRYRRLNLEEHDELQIGADPIDVAVISFGANDTQGVCDGGRCGKLMTPFWQEVIERRVRSYVEMLRRHGASIYWVGLPAMRDPAFDGDAKAMDAFYEGLMARLGVPFVDIRPLTIDQEGRYLDYFQDSAGRPRLLRAEDGVHMSMNGYVRIAKGLAARIRTSVSAARAQSGPPPAESAEGLS